MKIFVVVEERELRKTGKSLGMGFCSLYLFYFSLDFVVVCVVYWAL